MLVRTGFRRARRGPIEGCTGWKDLGRPERIFQLQAAGLGAGFPPLRSLGNRVLPNNWPTELSAFIGREREVAEVRVLAELFSPGYLDRGRLAGARPGWGWRWPPSWPDGSGTGFWLVEVAAVTDEARGGACHWALRLAAGPAALALEAAGCPGARTRRHR